MKGDLQFLIWPFALGLFVGVAIVAVAGTKRDERACHVAAAVSRLQGAKCDAAVHQAKAFLEQQIEERKKGCE